MSANTAADCPTRRRAPRGLWGPRGIFGVREAFRSARLMGSARLFGPRASLPARPQFTPAPSSVPPQRQTEGQPAQPWKRIHHEGTPHGSRGKAGEGAGAPRVAHARERSGPCERLLRFPASGWERDRWWGGNYKGTAGRDARGPSGCPALEQDLGRVNAFTPRSRWKGRQGARLGNCGREPQRNCGQGCPRTKIALLKPVSGDSLRKTGSPRGSERTP